VDGDRLALLASAAPVSQRLASLQVISTIF
jgi:hypothetical protein